MEDEEQVKKELYKADMSKGTKRILENKTKFKNLNNEITEPQPKVQDRLQNKKQQFKSFNNTYKSSPAIKESGSHKNLNGGNNKSSNP